MSNGDDPVAKGFAREILIFQSYEIGVMDKSLSDWVYSRANRSDTAMGWMNMSVPVDAMPGLATQAQLDQLKGARGHDADQLFLQLMRAHHMGGVHMALYASRHASSSDVRVLAAAMAQNQAIEVNEMADTATRDGYTGIAPYDGEPFDLTGGDS